MFEKKIMDGTIEYKMPKEMAKVLLKERKGAECNMTPQKYLCDYVNTQYNLKGTCIKVLTY